MFANFHDDSRPVYTIHIAAELLGCHPRTLRIYEEEGLIEPHRSKANYRLYSQEDLEMIQNICSLMEAKSLTLSGVKALFEMAERFHIAVDKMFEELLD